MMTFVTTASDFLSHLAFWWLLIGVFLVLARMPTPGMRMIDRKTYHEKKQELDNELTSANHKGLVDWILLYSGRYFFIYHYYRNDLVLLWAIGGALFLTFTSYLMERLNG